MTKGYAIVLGCSSGVGAEIAFRLASDGYGIIGFHRGHYEVEAGVLYEQIRCTGMPVTFFKMDAGRDVPSMMAAANEACYIAGERQVKVLVHSLSGASVGPLLTTDAAKQTKTFNYLAHSFLWWVQYLHGTARFAPDGLALALSNPCPDFYLQGSGAIGAAKAALEAYVKTLAVECEGTPRVNCLRFSTVLTPALKKVMPTAVERLETLHRSIVPIHRMQTTHDVAGIVSQLVDMPWINGAIVDGTGGAPYMLMNHAFHPPQT